MLYEQRVFHGHTTDRIISLFILRGGVMDIVEQALDKIVLTDAVSNLLANGRTLTFEVSAADPLDWFLIIDKGRPDEIRKEFYHHKQHYLGRSLLEMLARGPN